MSNVLYDASPSMIRMNPLGTVLVLLALFLGVLIAAAGSQLAAMYGFPDLDRRVFGVLGLALAVIAFFRLLSWWIATKVDRLKIKDDEIVWTHGLLSKQYVEIGLGSVRTVRVSQSLLQRILNAGDVIVFTSGDAPELVIRGLPNPDAVREHIKGQTERA
jgi:uncharacterized membrane protein YdbT with pleckstrin-like domain